MSAGVCACWCPYCVDLRRQEANSGVCAPRREQRASVYSQFNGGTVCVWGRGRGGGAISGHQSPEVYLFDQRQTSDVMEGGLGGGVGLGV